MDRAIPRLDWGFRDGKMQPVLVVDPGDAAPIAMWLMRDPKLGEHEDERALTAMKEINRRLDELEGAKAEVARLREQLAAAWEALERIAAYRPDLVSVNTLQDLARAARAGEVKDK